VVLLTSQCGMSDEETEQTAKLVRSLRSLTRHHRRRT